MNTIFLFMSRTFPFPFVFAVFIRWLLRWRDSYFFLCACCPTVILPNTCCKAARNPFPAKIISGKGKLNKDASCRVNTVQSAPFDAALEVIIKMKYNSIQGVSGSLMLHLYGCRVPYMSAQVLPHLGVTAPFYVQFSFHGYYIVKHGIFQ